MAEKILVIDDDLLLLSLARTVLEKDGYTVFTAADGEEGLGLFHSADPDLVILDVRMPGLSGWEVCQRLRESSAVPIIFLTCLGNEQDIVDGLLKGADDYIVKPIRINELRARIGTLLRRARLKYTRPDILSFADGELAINQAEQLVFAHGEEIALSPIEYQLLLFMAERPEQVISTQKLLDSVWKSPADAQQVKWQIWSLRQKIERDPKKPRFILTERGKGYFFSP